MTTYTVGEISVFRCLCVGVQCECGYRYHISTAHPNCPKCGRPDPEKVMNGPQHESTPEHYGLTQAKEE